ncbi:hypothetical protein [Paraburkholderia domus]|uniref:hypothetical protein n=1 Tax=Paraburkholderia domus TaxID=2793075 RepID=UPI001B216512|nr:hypothetical protein [Paraburkholderia domus]CAE6851295.1 hypothetical protein R75483_07611 [Paraburkholderia domus]
MSNDESPAIQAARTSLARFQADIQAARQQLDGMGDDSAVVDAAVTAVRSLSGAERVSDLTRSPASGAEPAASAQRAAISTVKALVDLASASRNSNTLSPLERAAIMHAEPSARSLVDVARTLAGHFATDADTSAMFSRVEKDAIEAYRQLSGRDYA